jgi:beta-lactamase class A
MPERGWYFAGYDLGMSYERKGCGAHPQSNQEPARAVVRFARVSQSLWFLLLIGALAQAQTPVTALWEQKTQERLRSLDSSLHGVLGVQAIDLTDGHTLSYHGDSQFPTASSIKIAVMIRMFLDAEAGRVRFADKVELNWVGNNDDSEGPLRVKLQQGPVTLTVRELVEAMMQWSDNSATNKCIDLAGMDRVNALLREIGARDTHLRRKMMDVAAATRGDENVATPAELSRLLELIYHERAASPDSCRQMLAIMKGVHNPYMRPGIPLSVELAAKPGDLSGVKCEAAIVFLKNRPFVVTVMSTYLDDNVNPVADGARIVFEYFAKIAVSNEWGRRLE